MNNHRWPKAPLGLAELTLVSVQFHDGISQRFPFGPGIELLFPSFLDQPHKLLQSIFGDHNAVLPAGTSRDLGGLSPPRKTKSLHQHVRSRGHVAQALWHRHSSIFTMDSRPQTLQKTVKSAALVPGRTLSTFPRPQAGHQSHPSFTTSLTDSRGVCKSFASISSKRVSYSTIFQDMIL